MGSIETRNRARREEGGAFFASPEAAKMPSTLAEEEKKGFLGIPPLKIFTPSSNFATKSRASRSAPRTVIIRCESGD